MSNEHPGLECPVTPRDGEPRADWRFLPPTQLAAHLLAVPQICDAAWTREPRLPGESREDFVTRVIGVPAQRGEAVAA